jgi:beta-galactosidase
MLADRIRELDPTRPVTTAFNGVNDAGDPVLASLEVAGYNYNPDKYVPDRARHPKRLMVMTESFGVNSFDYWAPVETCPWVLGDFIWTAIDYLGESGIGAAWLKGDPSGFLQPWPWFVSNCSDFDYCGFVKPQGLYRRVMWGVSPLAMTVHRPIPEGREETLSAWGWPDVEAHWTWPGCEGKDLEVHVYADCETVRLLLNGKVVGTKPGGRAARYLATFKVAFAPGELKAEARVGNRKIAETVLRTAGKPAKLRLSADRASIRNDRDALAYVTVEVLDAKGTVVPNASGPVGFSVSGAGELVAVGDGSPNRMASFTEPLRLPFQGRCLAILRPLQAGTIVLRAQGEGLSSTEVKVAVRPSGHF